MATRLSKLAAVNQMLSAIGQKPTNSLEGTTSMWTRIAVQTLDETDREVQGEGWYFNTDPNHTFSADANTGEVPVPVNTVRFKVYDMQSATLRDGKIYDRHNGTFDIGKALQGELVQYLDFDALPEVAKEYIVARSARKMYMRHVGSQENQRNLLMEETMAKSNLLNHDCIEGDYNMLDDVTIPFIPGSRYVPSRPRKHPRH